MEKIKILADGRYDGTPNSSSTSHLRPVIDFLLLQGNRPVREDRFFFEKDGHGQYSFREAIDPALVMAHFKFPASIEVYPDGSIQDSRNFVSLTRRQF